MNLIIIKNLLFVLVLLLAINTISYATNKTIATINTRNPFSKLVLETPSNYSDAPPLTRYPLSKLALCGVFQQQHESLAILRDQDGSLYPLKTGDVVGLEQAKITAIFPDKILLALPGDAAKNSLGSIILQLP